MQRFHLSLLNIKDNLITITDPRITHQTNKVLRMKPDDFFHVFNETKGEFLLQIESIEKKKLVAKQIKQIENRTEPKLKVSLYQAIPKKPATLELIVQKATELGVSEVYPMITERTQKKRLPKFERLQLIAMEATEQCGRLKIPTIHHPVDFEEVLPTLSNPLMAYELEQEKYLEDYGKEIYQNHDLQLIIGPEGGFSEHEVMLAKKNKVSSFSLGPRILRMETAAIVGLGAVLINKN